jgi:hypothetical protein
MIPNRFEDISKADIDALVTNGVPEGRTIDYKRTQPGGKDDEKREFLADVSSFANATGGDIIFGVDEDQGIPTLATGLPGIDPDAENLRLDSSIRSGIEPRIPAVQIKAVDGFPAGPVMVLRVPKSWSSPHMVTFKGSSRFFSRTNAGKFQMDVTEIRSAFLSSEAVPERIRRFRDDRLARIVAGETPLPMPHGAKMVLHILPIASFSGSSAVDVVSVYHNLVLLPPMSTDRWDSRMNLDGCVTYWQPPQEDSYLSYAQIFRSGVIEATDGFALTGGQNSIPPATYEEEVIKATGHYMKLVSKLGVQPPIVVMLAMLGVKGFTLATGPRVQFRGRPPIIDRDMLLLPEVVVEDLAAQPAAVLRPIFDALWQAAGYVRSLNYSENGTWNPRR